MFEKDYFPSSWAFQEAKSILDRYSAKKPYKGYVLFETGYGPSGLPHIGTFGEVARTTMVMHAFSKLSDLPVKLYAFSDDMDGLRKVPENIPNRDMVATHIGKPLTSIPDPYGVAESYGHYMNAKLREFLDHFGFSYEFKSATDCYKNGDFDKALIRVLECYDDVINVILPTLGNERRETYSPFLPVCKKTGRVLQVSVVEKNLTSGTIVYKDEDGTLVETPVTGGNCKLQWKADWAMRWYALDVNYEMYGKDLIPSADLSGKICEILGGKKPEGFSYELFLDDKGQKISKSKGNGLTIEEWLRYASPESLSLYMYNAPRKAKRLYFDVIPKAVDEYQTWLSKYESQDEKARYDNPVWHIHSANPPSSGLNLSYSLLLNLASACNPEDKSVLWGFISRYAAGATPEKYPAFDKLVGCAVNYYHDFVKPAKKYRSASNQEREAITELLGYLEAYTEEPNAEAIQTEAYNIGMKHGFELKDWFKALYEVLLGQSQGPRIGSFIALYGISETKKLISDSLNRVEA